MKPPSSPALPLLDPIVRPILYAAGAKQMAYFRRIGCERKGDGSPVTEADRAAEQVIVQGLSAAFPADAIRAEEGSERDGGGAARRCWYVDPLDGTSSFLEGLAHWGPTVGLLEGGRALHGALYLPRTGDYLHAEGGQAFWNDVRLPPLTSGPLLRSEVLYIPSRLHAHVRLDWPGKARNLGSISAHLCMVAAGGAAAALIPAGWQTWDTAAGLALIQGVGGCAVTFSGASLDLECHTGLPFVAGRSEAVQWMLQPDRLRFFNTNR